MTSIAGFAAGEGPGRRQTDRALIPSLTFKDVGKKMVEACSEVYPAGIKELFCNYRRGASTNKTERRDGFWKKLGRFAALEAHDVITIRADCDLCVAWPMGYWSC